jgi:beta-mannosidase
MKLALTTWQLKQHNGQHIKDWIPAQVPGNVHQTLLEQNLIPDPFYGTNELEVQWVGESDWLYRTTFQVSQEMLAKSHLELCFDGLDSFAHVSLNGEKILETDNMFIPYRVNVKDKLKAGDNELVIHFESALRRGKEIEAQRGKRPNWNGDSSRLYVRKAQYHYGWDWGPVILCAGPWRDVYIESYETRIADVYTATRLENDFKKAELDASVTLEGLASDVTLELYSPDGKLLESKVFSSISHTEENKGLQRSHQQQVVSGHQSHDDNGMIQGVEDSLPLVPPDDGKLNHALEKTLWHTFNVDNPQLWYPHGYGEHPLYKLIVKANGDSQELKIGFRDIQIVQEPVKDEAGSSFFFKVNGIEMFVGGANWIPDDLMLNRISDERYRERITQARDANMTMLRVWAGGIYEPDIFYDICDELGIMVWQDFLFGCGIYPAYPEFLENISREAEANIKRLRHHTSIALWCGNNEDYQIAESVGQYGSKGDANKFEALAIYEKLLPEICAKLDPTRFYWPGSPYGGPDSFNGTIGDRHIWDIWHGPMAPYQQYINYEGRFVSEFGMQSYPSLECFESVLPESERFPQSRTVVHHNRAFTPGFGPDGHRRLAVYVADTVRDPVTLSGYVYATQFVQAEAMHYAYSSFRRRWGVYGKRGVSGALVWQLNDCWPVTSWAIVDSLGIPKPAYYVIKRELEPTTLGLWRTKDGCDIWATNREEVSKTGMLELRAYNFAGQEIANEKRQVTINPNSTTEFGSWNVKDAMVISAKLQEKTSVTSRAALWSEPFKHYEILNPELSIEVLSATQLKLSVRKPAKGVWLDAACNDNFFDVMPGDDVIVTLREPLEHINAQWLGGETAVKLDVLATK